MEPKSANGIAQCIPMSKQRRCREAPKQKPKKQQSNNTQHAQRSKKSAETSRPARGVDRIADQSAQEDGPNKAQVQSMHARTDGRTDGRTDDAVRGDVVGLAVEDVRDAGVEVAGVAPNLKT